MTSVTLQGDTTGTLPIGPPYRAVMAIREFWPAVDYDAPRSRVRGTSQTVEKLAEPPVVVRLSLSFLGGADEVVSEIRHIEGNRTDIPLSSRQSGWPAEPVYQVMKTDGELVAQGTFEYG